MRLLTDLNISDLGKYFHKLAEISQDVFWISDIDYKTSFYISPAFTKIWGRSKEELYSNINCWVDSIHPDDREKYDQFVAKIQLSQQESESYSMDYRILRPDGDIRFIREASFPLYDVNHEFIGFAGIAKDVTRENERLAELERASLFFRYFAEKIRACFWARDDSCDRQIYLSPGYEKIWGRSCQSLYDSPNTWLDTLHPEDREQASNTSRFRTLEEAGPDVQYENRYRIFRGHLGVWNLPNN